MNHRYFPIHLHALSLSLPFWPIASTILNCTPLMPRRDKNSSPTESNLPTTIKNIAVFLGRAPRHSSRDEKDRRRQKCSVNQPGRDMKFTWRTGIPARIKVETGAPVIHPGVGMAWGRRSRETRMMDFRQLWRQHRIVLPSDGNID